MKASLVDNIRYKTNSFRKIISKLCGWSLLYSGFLTFMLMIYDLGYQKPEHHHIYLRKYYLLFIVFVLFIYTIRNIINLLDKELSKKYKWMDFSFLLAFLYLYFWIIHEVNFAWMKVFEPYYKYIIGIFFVLTLVYEYSKLVIKFYQKNINPAFIFVFVFFLLSISGTLMLKLPNSTYDGISFIDALFTSVSAVCITGMTVVDIGSVFTPFGHKIILGLMQVGGLGVMTFAGLIGRIFASGISFQQKMMLNEYIVGDQLNEVWRTIGKIVFITLLVESIGATFIFFSTMNIEFASVSDRLFFAIFHSVSAFCNTGFVTLKNGMHSELLRFNYSFQLTVAALFLFGGIGFPIVFAFYKNIKVFLKNTFKKIFFGLRPVHLAQHFDVNSKLNIYTTLGLIVFGFVFIWIFEGNTSLFEHDLWGKIVGVFFATTTSRSAGFNTIDMTMISFPTIMLYLLYMWIGASPGGTGGGIKTITFSLAVLNFWSIASGKEKIIVFGREISQESIKRAFAIISLSLIFMGSATFLIYSFDGRKDLIKIVFDVFSAFNNCGLSLGITSELTFQSKFILAASMFIGRVSALTLFSAFMYKRRFNNYKYPSQDIIY